MADQDKRKTKTVILRELESIKGLLDDDDIPLLQEVIDSAEEEADSQETLDGEDLAELQQAYQDLLQARGIEPEWPAGGEEPPILHEIEEAPKAPVKTPWEEVQTSLFDTDGSLTEPAPSTTRRSSVTKASGENPFLPAHIRDRLHGNRPPPLFEPIPPVNKSKPAPNTIEPNKTGPATLSIDRMQLVEEVVNSLLPQVRAKLHDALMEMDAQQLNQLLNDAPASHKPE